LRESTDSTQIDIARNDGFGMVEDQSGKLHEKASDLQYFEHLQKYLASASEESMNF
jgi:hypothetical protein